ncbi:Phosphoenolpyruvate synthase [Fundidesulfovibrio magnetotacticus]|uniref:Phosphoenolpyruvate synthase n=1 Tax=Fundidesulfovibrio magnetotacticus TaxID=2730080 RepID=A0A6V8M0V3_9BACT|nr:PEP/pyruvate-binding domain-containing protein [Fundidesulfovibrio magnetotacticus]GFK94095.1 Phosphoenolpyruvate synthase [Fundidesulfovibrio magnetotacticus]
MARIQSPLLDGIKRLLRPLFGASCRPAPTDQTRFRFKYVNFQELLESNSELLRIIASVEEKLPGREVFGMAFLHSVASQAVFHGLRMLRGYENLSDSLQPQLRERIQTIQADLKNALSGQPHEVGPWFLDFSDIDRASTEVVGGKCANLGESRNKVGLPIPAGFAITTFAFRSLLDHSDLGSEIAKLTMALDASDPASIQAASEDIQRLMLLAPLPDGFEARLLEMQTELAARVGVDPESIKVSMRSSAVGEDGELSFAGQYLSILGVSRAKLAESYRYVTASLYTPRAIAYRLLKGVPDEAAAMGVACLAMVDSVASGVMYTRHPFDRADEDILINAVWGLGPYAVDGVVTPDSYRVRKQSLEILSQEIARQEFMLAGKQDGGVERLDVNRDLISQPCLTRTQIRTLADWGQRLEAHYGSPQDVEWALDGSKRLVLLQARPLAGLPREASHARPAEPPVADAEMLLEGGATACPGSGYGEVFLVTDDDSLALFPEGGILVARHSSPKFMVAMTKARAIVTDHGSVTGHMASLAREFNVPTILGLSRATDVLRTGVTVTVDAVNRRVYKGLVDALLDHQEAAPAPMAGTPIHALLRNIHALLAPLNLVDPKAPSFSPAHCRTMHDITRYLHERSYAAMFTLGDEASGEGGMAQRLEAGVGLDLHVIDLGGGLAGDPCARDAVSLRDILSVPFKALMEGLADEQFVAKGPRPVHLRGFLSVMGRQMVDGPNMASERFGERSYAIISDKYLNFSSRVGYHYGVLDCYCGKTVNKNYITFAFKGGAAGEERRERRARAIGLILERLGFTVTTNADRVEGRFQKYPPELVRERLVQLGRLLQFTRQTDMLMTSEQAIPAMADAFLRGETVFGVGAVQEAGRE